MAEGTSEQNLRRTPLYERHVALNARMAGFGGYLMPIQYKGIIQEHEATRTGVTIFDTCHMGEFRIQGPQAVDDLQRLVTCDVAMLSNGQCRYGLMCNEEGGVIDDLLVYRFAPDTFMLVVNAGTQDSDFAWISERLSPGTQAENLSAETAKLDIQGPGSPKLVAGLLAEPIDDMRFYWFSHNVFEGEQILVSRTGYTGEIGFEIYAAPDVGCRIWDACVSGGAAPAGLGARDTLRLEMGMPLYGHELGVTRNAVESGFASPKTDGKEYIGSAAIRDPASCRQSLVGITIEGRRSARAGDAVADADGNVVGEVTSGSFAPTLGHAVAMGYVDTTVARDGTAVAIQTARQPLPGRIVKPPFYKGGTARSPLSAYLGPA